MDIFYALLGLVLMAYEAMDNAYTSLAATVGGGGVLLALISAFIALVIAENASNKVEELSKKVEELEGKLEEKEDEVSAWEE